MTLYVRMWLICIGLCLASVTYAPAQQRSNTSTCSITRNGIRLSWQPYMGITRLKLPPVQGGAKLPLKYSVYLTDARRLKQFLDAINKKGEKPSDIVLPVSGAIGCRAFTVRSSGTLSPELAAKYPQLASLKGEAVENKNATLRLDYDGKVLNAEIFWDGTYYIIAPWRKGLTTYYLVYRKEDSGVEKKPFEVKR